MSEHDSEGIADPELEDDGILDPADSLEDEDLLSDPLDTGIGAGEKYRAATRFGTTLEEQREGESLDQLLAEEEPEPAEDEWTDEDAPPDRYDGDSRRAGRLVAPDEGTGPDREADVIARDVGIDGAGASAEEAAMHLTEEPPLR